MRVSACILIFSLVLALLATAPPRRSFASGDEWLRVTSKHFTLIGDAKPGDIHRIALNLEQFRAAVLRLLGDNRKNISSPITVVVFRNDERYKPYKPLYKGEPSTISGYFQASDDKAYITLSANWRDSNPYEVIFHEYVHLLTSDFKRRLPAWIGEGLAEYFSTFQMGRGEKTIRIGLPIKNHIRRLREQTWMPLPELFAVNESSPYYNEADKKRIFYSQSWALIHYLLIGRDGRRQSQFNRFLENLTTDKPPDVMFSEVFGTDYAGLESELIQYVARENFPSEVVKFEGRIEFDSTLQTEPLDVSTVQAYLGDLLWRIQRQDDAKAHFQRAFEINPDNEFAHKTLGILHFRQRNYAQARQRLKRAVDLGSIDHLAHYYYAMALQWEQVDETHFVTGFQKDSADAMRRALNRAIELEPLFPDSYKQLAFINLVLNENLDQSLELLDKSLELAPERQDFAYAKAQVYMRLRNYTEAKRIAESVLQKTEPTELHDNARMMLDIIKGVEERLAQKQAEDVGKQSGRVNKIKIGPGERFEGEQARGMLVRIDCDDEGIKLSVKSDGRLYRFFSRGYGKLIFVRYTSDIPNEITCGAINPQRPVIVTYKKTNGAEPGIDGEPVGVEFIKPDN